MVSLAHLVVDQLPPSSPDAQALASELRALVLPDRISKFAALIQEANRTPSEDPLKGSGELSFYTKDQLIPELAAVAFDTTAVTGSVLGPIRTVAGDELFMVRSRFSGTLDERSGAALIQARLAPDLAALASRISPTGDAPRASGSVWRAQQEFAGDPHAAKAFNETALGQLSDPFVFDGQIVVLRPVERRTNVLDADALARVVVNGFGQWLQAQRNAASIVIDPEPLPGVGGPSLSPSASGSELPANSAPPPSGILPRPPTSTDPFGLPTFRVVP
jgi:hypothetical protein